MPVMGPRINDNEVLKAYNEVMILLKEKYRIQAFPLPDYPDYSVDRIERNKVLYKAIESLFELESWESW